MAQYMVDTSALAKDYHPEIGSSQVIAIADNLSNVLFISPIGLVEIHSALARKVRTGELQVAAFQQALRRFYADLRGRKFRLIRPVSMHERQAICLLVPKAWSFRCGRSMPCNFRPLSGSKASSLTISSVRIQTVRGCPARRALGH